MSEEDSALCAETRVVLNRFEFVSMAVNCKVINNDVIKESWAHFFEVIYSELKDYIKESRKLKEEPDLLINFTTLSEQWHPKLKEKVGRPAKKA